LGRAWRAAAGPLNEDLNQLAALAYAPPALESLLREAPAAGSAGLPPDLWAARCDAVADLGRAQLDALRDALAAAAPRRRRRPSGRQPAPITPAELEAYTLVADHKGNVAAAARAAGKSRQVMHTRYKRALHKLTQAGVKNPRAIPLPTDRRGQIDVAGQ
jgi:predicted DNA-binding protein (UPF0251 family)